MGWNCTVALVRGATVADLGRLGWTPTPSTVAWDEATSSAFDGIAAWERDGDLVVASGGLQLLGEVERLGALADTCAGVLGSVSDTYLWETAGPAGESARRLWHWSVGEVVLDSGTPHPAEAGVERLDEDAVLDLLQAAGLTWDDRLEEAAFVVLDTGGRGGEPSAPPRRRKRFGLF
jgi:hypothetical protein